MSRIDVTTIFTKVLIIIILNDEVVKPVDNKIRRVYAGIHGKMTREMIDSYVRAKLIFKGSPIY